jgi:hypothetical protein
LNDLEYLAQAGIDAETGSAPSAEATVSNTTPETAPQTEQTTDTAAAQKAQQEMFEINGQKYPTNTEFQLTHGGKILKVPYSTMANTYRQWSHFQDKIKAFNEEKTQFTERYKDHDKYKGFYDQWGQFQEWSLQNPQQAESLLEMWKNKDSHLLKAQMGAQTSDPAAQGLNIDPLVQKLQQYEEKFGKYDQVLSKYEQAEKTRQETEDVNFVKKEINDFQAEYPEIKLDERDPEGVSLWAKIVQWGLTRGFTEFKPAAMMYLQDRVKDVWSTRARQEALKGLKSDHQNGIVKRSATPVSPGQRQETPQKDIRKMSYGELADLAKQDLAAQ